MDVGLEIIHPGACPGLRLTNGPLPPWHHSRQACSYCSRSQSSAACSSTLQLLPSAQWAQQGCQDWEVPGHKLLPYRGHGVRCVSGCVVAGDRTPLPPHHSRECRQDPGSEMCWLEEQAPGRAGWDCLRAPRYSQGTTGTPSLLSPNRRPSSSRHGF